MSTSSLSNHKMRCADGARMENVDGGCVRRRRQTRARTAICGDAEELRRGISSNRCCSEWRERGSRSEGEGGKRIRSEKPVITKKAPETGASEWNSSALFRASPQLLLFLRSSLLFRGGLFGCALHRLILPNIKFCDSKKSQCDSYIRLFAMKVKKKMQVVSHSDLFRVAPLRIYRRRFSRGHHILIARSVRIYNWTPVR